MKQPDGTRRIVDDETGTLIQTGGQIEQPEWLRQGRDVMLRDGYEGFMDGSGDEPCTYQFGRVIEVIGPNAFGVPRVGLWLYEPIDELEDGTPVLRWYGSYDAMPDCGAFWPRIVDFAASELVPLQRFGEQLPPDEDEAYVAALADAESWKAKFASEYEALCKFCEG